VAEQGFLGDAMLDRVMLVVMNLAEELYVARDRLQVLERLLEDKGILAPDEAETFVPDADLAARMKTFRDAYVARLLDGAVRPDADRG
jgi:hypothetical protein